MVIDIQTDILLVQDLGLLDILLADKTTGRHIVWASGAKWADEMGANDICNIQTRAAKSKIQQSDRTRRRGEVFTPLWVCARMNDYADAALVTDDWRQYVDKRVLEITCGEAPYLVSRYDTVTGEVIPLQERIGLLDRKLRMVSGNTKKLDDWFHWAKCAFTSTYGYEFQGDNLFVARLNLLMAFMEYFKVRWGIDPKPELCRSVANIIVWNIWQMDGLTGRVPSKDGTGVPCTIFDWDKNMPVAFWDVKESEERKINGDTKNQPHTNQCCAI